MARLWQGLPFLPLDCGASPSEHATILVIRPVQGEKADSLGSVAGTWQTPAWLNLPGIAAAWQLQHTANKLKTLAGLGLLHASKVGLGAGRWVALLACRGSQPG